MSTETQSTGKHEVTHELRLRDMNRLEVHSGVPTPLEDVRPQRLRSDVALSLIGKGGAVFTAMLYARILRQMKRMRAQNNDSVARKAAQKLDFVKKS